MTVNKKYFTAKADRKIKEVLGIVVHWPAGRLVPSLDNVWNYLETQSPNGYHYLVSGGDVLSTIPYPYRALHTGHTSYTEQAKEIFGERATSNLDSPNNYSLGVCILQDFANGHYSAKTFLTAAKLVGELCHQCNLDPFMKVLRHTDVVGVSYKQCPLEFVEDQDMYNCFLHNVSMFKEQMSAGDMRCLKSTK